MKKLFFLIGVFASIACAPLSVFGATYDAYFTLGGVDGDQIVDQSMPASGASCPFEMHVPTYGVYPATHPSYIVNGDWGCNFVGYHLDDFASSNTGEHWLGVVRGGDTYNFKALYRDGLHAWHVNNGISLLYPVASSTVSNHFSDWQFSYSYDDTFQKRVLVIHSSSTSSLIECSSSPSEIDMLYYCQPAVVYSGDYDDLIVSSYAWSGSIPHLRNFDTGTRYAQALLINTNSGALVASSTIVDFVSSASSSVGVATSTSIVSSLTSASSTDMYVAYSSLTNCNRFASSDDSVGGVLVNLCNGFLYGFPWGYATRFIEIIASESTSTLPVLSYTFGSSTPLDGLNYTFDLFTDEKMNVLATVFTDQGDNKNLWDVVEPFFAISVWLSVLFVILKDVIGIELSGRDSGHSLYSEVDVRKRKRY